MATNSGNKAGFNLNLNDPPNAYVLLEKDKKPICRMICANPPLEVPFVWKINQISLTTKFPLSGLPQFSIRPAPENFQQKNEWDLFLCFLQKYQRVAIVNSVDCDFYILPPDAGKSFDHAVVPYRIIEHVVSDSSSIESHGPKRFEIDSVKDIRKSDATTTLYHSPTFIAQRGDFVCKSSVRSDPSYLQTLGEAHAGWVFGAMAELVDNSRDAKANRLDIAIETLYSKKAGEMIPVLSFLDDGCGMSHDEIVRMLTFGHKQPEGDDPGHIGRFGIGFKTGAMRLGRDAIVLTQSLNSRSIAFLSQSFNADKSNIEIPIVSYRKVGSFMEVDTSLHSEAEAEAHLKAIKEFSPFNEYFIGEKSGLFGETGTGTQIYIWDLAKWGSNFIFEWTGRCISKVSSQSRQGDILIRSRRIRSRPGQTSKEVPLDYSLQAYLEVIFLDPRMKIYAQGSLVKSRPLAKSLSETAIVKDVVMGKSVQLALGWSRMEWMRVNCGMFLYWHGRLIEAYKRVGGMVHNADMGRGVIGVIDVTDIMKDGNNQVKVLSNKQGFQDCEEYAKLEDWLGHKADEYWDANFDTLELRKGNARFKPDHEWVQCNKCRKWRILSVDFDTASLPEMWFCHMRPFSGTCSIPEQEVKQGVITVGAKRSGCDSKLKVVKYEENERRVTGKTVRGDSSGEDSTQTIEDKVARPVLKRLRRGLPRGCKSKKA